MKVKVIPVLEDNYMYLIIEEHTRKAVAIDVAVAERVRTKDAIRGLPEQTGPPYFSSHLIYYLWDPLKYDYFDV